MDQGAYFSQAEITIVVIIVGIILLIFFIGIVYFWRMSIDLRIEHNKAVFIAYYSLGNDISKTAAALQKISRECEGEEDSDSELDSFYIEVVKDAVEDIKESIANPLPKVEVETFSDVSGL